MLKEKGGPKGNSKGPPKCYGNKRENFSFGNNRNVIEIHYTQIPVITITSYSRHPLKYTHHFISLDTGKTVVIGSATAAGGVGLIAIIVLAVLFVKCRIGRLLLNRNEDTTEDEHLHRRLAHTQEDDMNDAL